MQSFPRKVYEYLDYRSYLRDYYAHQKRHEYGFSYRVLSRRAGCRSTNFPQLVITGKRNLSGDSALRFSEACGLSGGEQRYFCDLVTFNQADTQREKEHAFKNLERHAQFRKVHEVTTKQANYFTQWYYVAIRELAARSDFEANPQWIAERLTPAITVGQARRALAALLQLGMLELQEDGRIVATDKLVRSEGPMGHQLAGFHRMMLKRAIEAIEVVERSERDISALTVCVSEERMHELMREVQKFRARLLQLAERDDTPERVVHLGFQVFPLSRKVERTVTQDGPKTAENSGQTAQTTQGSERKRSRR